jgi:hypothetical protein
MGFRLPGNIDWKGTDGGGGADLAPMAGSEWYKKWRTNETPI